MFHTCLFLTFLSFLKVVSCTPALSYLVVTRVGPCQDRQASEVITVKEMSILKEKSGTFLNGPVTIHKDMMSGWSVKLIMQKCHDIRNLDTCDLYKAMTVVRSGCDDSEQASLYENFFNHVTPNEWLPSLLDDDFAKLKIQKDNNIYRLRCPVKAGRYIVKGFPFFTKDSMLMVAESKISTSVFGYKYRLEGLNEEEERIFCVDAYLRMVYVRQHDWLEGQYFDSAKDHDDDAAGGNDNKEATNDINQSDERANDDEGNSNKDEGNDNVGQGDTGNDDNEAENDGENESPKGGTKPEADKDNEGDQQDTDAANDGTGKETQPSENGKGTDDTYSNEDTIANSDENQNTEDKDTNTDKDKNDDQQDTNTAGYKETEVSQKVKKKQNDGDKKEDRNGMYNQENAADEQENDDQNKDKPEEQESAGTQNQDNADDQDTDKTQIQENGNEQENEETQANKGTDAENGEGNDDAEDE